MATGTDSGTAVGVAVGAVVVEADFVGAGVVLPQATTTSPAPATAIAVRCFPNFNCDTWLI